MKVEPMRVIVRARLLNGDELDYVRDRLEDALGLELEVTGDELVGELEIPYRIEVGRAGRVEPSAPVRCDACGEPLRSLEPYVVELTPKGHENRLYHFDCKPDK